MKKILTLLTGAVLLVGSAAWGETVEYWISSEDGAFALSPGTTKLESSAAGDTPTTIRLNPEKRYQSILGLGASFEHATCENLAKLDEEKRREVIRKIVHPEDGIGMNLMRVCIGTSDFTGQPWYSYNDMPDGETDPELKNFSIEKDREIILPVLKTALEINPDLLYFASPWSPPGWMKTTGTMLGGKVKPEFYNAYAGYLVKFLQAYEAEGLPMYALTPQNEPGYPNPEYPTTRWTGEQQRDFIREYLGPALTREGFDTKLWCWDHNWNYLKFPRTVLSDPDAAKFVDGTAFHFYEGEVTAMTEFHEEFPEKNIYFTEGSTFRTHGAIMIIDILRNWARSYNAWVIMLDEDRKPNNGPHSASATSIELMHDGTVEYRFDYFMYGQFMKFIPRGAVRIDSGEAEKRFAHVAFEDEHGDRVLVVANAEREEHAFEVRDGDHGFRALLPGRAVGTWRWNTGL